MKRIRKKAIVWLLTFTLVVMNCLLPCTAEAPAETSAEETVILETGLTADEESTEVQTAAEEESTTELQTIIEEENVTEAQTEAEEITTEVQTVAEEEMTTEPETVAEEEITTEPETVAEEETATEPETVTEEETTEEVTELMIPEDDIEAILSRPVFMNLGDVTPAMEITSCKISGSNVIVEGRMNISFTTWNGEFYLFEEAMYEEDITGDPIASVEQSETFRFTVPLNLNTEESRLYSKFFVGVQFRSGDYFALGTGKFITNPEVLAANQNAYPTEYSKKGLFAETYWGTDMDELGVNHVTVNLLMNDLFSAEDFEYVYNGKTYYFSKNYIYGMDDMLSVLKKNDIMVYGILLVRPKTNSRNFSFPGINQSVGNYHGWNVVTDEGIETVSAAIHFLAERYGRADGKYGHIANWIVSNEVNADTSWNYTGHQSVSEYALIYSNMMRITYQAVKSNYANARIYMPLDMFWNNSANSTRYDGKRIVDLVNTYLKAEGDIAWGVAFHPYANPLTEAEWWNDHAEQHENAGFISMQNLSVLTNYLQKSGLRDPDGSVKKVILSEQGFTSYSNNQGNVEWKQAAAYAYAYYVAEANPYVQAIIVMRHKDASVEAADGLHQGIWYDNVERPLCTFAKKPVWTVWKYIDTAHSFEYTDSLASLVGLSSFSGTYGNVMASKSRTVLEGKGGYAGSFDQSTAFGGTWTGEFMVRNFSYNNGLLKADSLGNSQFAYSSVLWNGNADFSSKPIFGFDFKGTAGADQNLRVRMRFTSGQNVFETEVSAEKDLTHRIYADLSGWAGRSSVNRIQIWVQQDGAKSWENGTFEISNICMAAGTGSAETAPLITITDAGISTQTANGFDIYCKTEGTGTLSKAEFSAWHIKTGTVSVVTQIGTVNGNTASAHFDLASFGWKAGAYNVRVIAYDDKGIASKETVVSVNVASTADALVLSNVYITEYSSSGFTIIAEANSSYGMAASQAAVWSVEGGQDDMVWYPLTFNNGKASARVNISNHKYSSGEYMCHVYARDNAGSQKVFVATATVPTVLPEIISAEVTDVSALGYTVTCTFSCPNGLNYVTMPTWTDAHWQDDIRWYTAPVSGNTATLFIKTSDHNKEAGLYYTHVYVFDKLEKSAIRCLEIKIPEDLKPEKLVPKITKVETSEVTSSGYRVTAEFTSPAGVREVVMPTWTSKNGQDDLIWHHAEVSGNKATFYVKTSAHKNETGTYITHVYLRDNLGQEHSAGTEVVVPAPQVKPPTVNPTGKLQILSMKTSEVTSKGYKVTVTFEAPAGVQKVEMPTWTSKNGQDDLIWHQAEVSGTTAAYYVSVSDHKGEIGTYITHVYVYDKAGKKVLDGFEVTVPKASSSETPGGSSSGGSSSGSSSTPTVTPTGKLRIVSAKAVDVTAKGYRVDVVFEAPKGVKEIVVPTWTSKNGQDDLIWHQAQVSGNTATYYVSVSDHKGESGAYITHVYVRDKAGKEVLTGLDITVPKASSSNPSGGSSSGGSSSGSSSTPTVTPTGKLRIVSAKAVDVTAKGYRIDIVFEAPTGVKEVVVPTWTSKNGQDDLVWHQAEVSGNTATFYVPVSAHKGESGAYITHVYVRDKAGKEVLTGLDITVPSGSGSAASTAKPSISNVTVSEQSASGYRVTVTFSAPAGVKEVKMPSWSNVNGQDDVVWHQATISGNTATCYISKSAHKNNTGAYTTHIYVYDVLGQQVIVGANAVVR